MLKAITIGLAGILAAFALKRLFAHLIGPAPDLKMPPAGGIMRLDQDPLTGVYSPRA